MVEALDEALPPSVATVVDVAHFILSADGIWIRMSFAAVATGVREAFMVICEGSRRVVYLERLVCRRIHGRYEVGVHVVREQAAGRGPLAQAEIYPVVCAVRFVVLGGACREVCREREIGVHGRRGR